MDDVWAGRFESHTVDVELTNRCNTHCDFCPRDRTPHQGMMTDEVFDRVVERLVEFRDHCADLFGVRARMSFCGLGEQLLHRRGPDHVRRVSELGFRPSMCTNGATLDDRHARALVDAGLRRIYVNCGEIGDDYEEVYHLPFDRLVANIDRFLAISGERCQLHVVLVDHRQDPERMEAAEAFWRARGVRYFFPSPMLNRSGSIEVVGMGFDAMPEQARAVELYERLGTRPVCPAATGYPFIGYDGTYYLCSSDWEKQVATGSVFDGPIVGSFAARLDAVTERDPICRHCNHDPINKTAVALAALDRGEVDYATVRADALEAIGHSEVVHEEVRRIAAAGLAGPAAAEVTGPTPAVAGRRSIPVRAV